MTSPLDMVIKFDAKIDYGSLEIMRIPTGVYAYGEEVFGLVSVTKDENGNITKFEICEPVARLELA